MFKWKLKQKWEIKLMLFWYPQQSMCEMVCDFTSTVFQCSMHGMAIVLLENISNKFKMVKMQNKN